MINSVPDIPRLHTAIAEWLACVIYLIPMEKRFGKLRTAGLMVIFLPVLLLTNIIGENVPISLWMIFMLLGMLAMYFMIYICSRSTPIEAGYYWTRAFLVAEFAASLEWQFYYYYLLSNDFSWIIMNVCMVVVFLGVFLIVFIMENRRKHVGVSFRITSRELFGSMLIALAAFLISNLNFAFKDSVISASTGAGSLYVRTVVDMAGIILLYAHEESRKEISLRYELNAMDSLFNRQYEQYQQFMENNESVRRIYHDLKHQIEFIRKEKDEKLRDHYLEEMDEAIRIYESDVRTGNSVLDTLIAGKNLLCNEKKIKMTCYADAELLEFMDAMDICSIFGNALDNAIEYEEQIEDENKRLIKLTVSRQNRFLMIRIDNYCEKEISMNGEIPESTKHDPSVHGFGIKSIKRAAEKYAGHISMGNQDNWFFLMVLLPLPEELLQNMPGK